MVMGWRSLIAALAVPRPPSPAQALCEMGATVGPVDTEKFASDLEGLWTKFNSLDPEAMLAASGGGGDGSGR